MIWSKKNLLIKDAVYISKFNLSTIEEFELMKRFRNIIISNSTFSLWASLLNHHSNKLIIVPKNWFVKNNEYATKYLLIDQMIVLKN